MPKAFTALPSIANPVIDFTVASLLPPLSGVTAEAMPFDAHTPPGLSVLSQVILRI
jgi:hypothetical protein